MSNESSTSSCCNTIEEEIFRYLNSLVGFLILGGNLLTCAVFLRNKRMRREFMNVFLVSLAISGIFVALLVIPGYTVYCTGCLHQRSELCWIFEAAKDFAFLSTIFNVMAITYDRYIAVLKPLQYKRVMTQRTASTILTCVWIASALLTSVRCIWQVTIPKAASEYNEIYTYFLLFSFVFVPVGVLSVVNVKIIFAIRAAERKNVLQMITVKKLKEDVSFASDYPDESLQSLLNTRSYKAQLSISSTSASTCSKQDEQATEQTNGQIRNKIEVRERSYSHNPNMIGENSPARLRPQACNYSKEMGNVIERRVRSYSHNPNMICENSPPRLHVQASKCGEQKGNEIEMRVRSYSGGCMGNKIEIRDRACSSSPSMIGERNLPSRACSCCQKLSSSVGYCASNPRHQRSFTGSAKPQILPQHERRTGGRSFAPLPNPLLQLAQRNLRNKKSDVKRKGRGSSFLLWLHSHVKHKRLEHIRTKHGTMSCILVVAGFVVTWLPHACLKLYQLFGQCDYVCPCLVNITLLFLFVQSSINPVIYGFYRIDFRKATRQMLCPKPANKVAI